MQRNNAARRCVTERKTESEKSHINKYHKKTTGRKEKKCRRRRLFSANGRDGSVWGRSPTARCTQALDRYGAIRISHCVRRGKTSLDWYSCSIGENWGACVWVGGKRAGADRLLSDTGSLAHQSPRASFVYKHLCLSFFSLRLSDWWCKKKARLVQYNNGRPPLAAVFARWGTQGPHCLNAWCKKERKSADTDQRWWLAKKEIKLNQIIIKKGEREGTLESVTKHARYTDR